MTLKNEAFKEKITQLEQSKKEEDHQETQKRIPTWVTKGKEMLFKMLQKSLPEEEIKKQILNNPIQLQPVSLKNAAALKTKIRRRRY